MSIFRKIAGGLADGIDRAQWEADKLVKINRIHGEVSDLEKELASAQARLANQVLELHSDGRLQVPELDEPIWGIADVEARLDEKKEELAATSTMKFEDVEGVQKTAQAEGAKPAQPQLADEQVEAELAPLTTLGEAAPEALFCSNCGTSLQPDARFCPECGYKVGE